MTWQDIYLVPADWKVEETEPFDEKLIDWPFAVDASLNEMSSEGEEVDEVTIRFGQPDFFQAVIIDGYDHPRATSVKIRNPGSQWGETINAELFYHGETCHSLVYVFRG